MHDPHDPAVLLASVRHLAAAAEKFAEAMAHLSQAAASLAQRRPAPAAADGWVGGPTTGPVAPAPPDHLVDAADMVVTAGPPARRPRRASAPTPLPPSPATEAYRDTWPGGQSPIFPDPPPPVDRDDLPMLDPWFGSAGDLSDPPPASAAGQAPAPEPSPHPEPTPAPAKRGRGRPRKYPERDRYAALSPDLRASFDRLWGAYGLPRGRDGAADIWGRINPDPATAERIIAAAARDARHAINGGADYNDGLRRLYLQGWLSQRRYADGHPDPAAAPRQEAAARQAAAINRSAEIATLKRMIDALERNGQPVHPDLRRQLSILEGAA